MSDIFDFDLTIDDLPESNSGEYTPIPEGVYIVQIADANLAKNNSNAGCHLKVKLSLVSQPYSGRTVFSIINIQNPSERAEEIGRKQLRPIMMAAGVTRLTPDAVKSLVGARVKAKVVIKEKSTGGQTNDIAWYNVADDVAQEPVAPKKSAPAKSFKDEEVPF